MTGVSQLALYERDARAKAYSHRANRSRRSAARLRAQKIKGTAVCVAAIAMWAVILACLLGSM